MNKYSKLISLGVVLTLLAPGSVLAADSKAIVAGFNQVSIKVNDQPFTSNNILYNGTTYVPIRDVAALLGLAVNYREKTKTAYIGEPGAGEFTEADHDIDTWDVVTPATPSNDPIMEKQETTIQVNLNEITVKAFGDTLQSDNFVYQGTTYVPLRAAADATFNPVNFDPETYTVYIGKTSKTFPPAAEAQPQKQEPAPKSKMYAVPADGEMAGWQLLKGHEREKDANIYFQLKGSLLSVHLEPIQTEDLNQVIEWTDDKGKKRKNKLGDLYKLFGTFSNQYSDDYLYSTFGDVYANWLEPSTIRAENIVDQYLKETGQLN